MRAFVWHNRSALRTGRRAWSEVWQRLRGRATLPQEANTVPLEPAADPWHIEPLQGAQRWFVDALREGLHHGTRAPVQASYGVGASLRVDFAQGSAYIDAAALKALRVERRLPCLESGSMPSADAYRHDLQELAWDVGLACGRAGWFDAPADPWHQPLIGVAANRIARFTRLERHLTIARELQAQPLTPAQLLERVPIEVPALRRALQACLMLGLVRWA